MDQIAPIFIDFEASAINGYPIQVAYGSSESDLKSHLIKPLEQWMNDESLWDENAEAIHGFSLSYLNIYGVNALSVAKEVSRDLQGKIIYSDSKADLTWLGWLFNDCAHLSGEQYEMPKFELIQKLVFENGFSDDQCYRAQILANEKFKSRGLVAHKADADTLKHIWTWEALNAL